ncbi:MAG TPA: two-component regulator propeller domain-containing protein, partial [Flavobacteriales bacterium]|nr:two-component regulator propeller domain-containing protein [Flavobacteriales bacterium]
MRYLGDRFVTFTTKDGLCSDLVMNITADHNGDLWLGTYDNGICRMDGMAMITTLDGLPNNTVWCGLLAKDGSLWFGTSDGLAHVINGLVVPLPDSTSLTGQRVFALHEDGAGALWCGTREGLSVITATGMRQDHPGDGGPLGRSVRAITNDADGVLWLGSDNGLVSFKDETFHAFTTADGLADNTVLCLGLDHHDRLWIGTANGITCYEQGHFSVIHFGSDFGSNYINFLSVDANDRIWAGTNNGLFRFAPDELLKAPEAYEHVTMSDGLRSLEFNLNAAYQWSDARSLFGSAAGLVLHQEHPASASSNARLPLVHILALRSFLQTTDWKGQCAGLDMAGLPRSLHVDARRHYLTFDYAAISLSQPERIRYRYRVVGYDPDWLPSTEARFASYSNLPHGEFTFEVSASLDGRAWGPSARFAFTI